MSEHYRKRTKEYDGGGCGCVLAVATLIVITTVLEAAAFFFARWLVSLVF